MCEIKCVVSEKTDIKEGLHLHVNKSIVLILWTWRVICEIWHILMGIFKKVTKTSKTQLDFRTVAKGLFVTQSFLHIRNQVFSGPQLCLFEQADAAGI